MATNFRFYCLISKTILVLLLAFNAGKYYVLSVAPLTPNAICLPNPPPLTALQLALPFSTCAAEIKQGLAKRHPDQDKDTAQILKTYRYPFKAYNVTTKDGYILKVYRITGSPKIKGKQNEKKQAVYVQHGLFAASDCWNFQPGSRNLPFKLADAGYEVWLGNARGTSYSLGHVKYDSIRDWKQYWNFSWHEMGKYDLPAVTTKIITESKNDKIFYIGHSMGTTMYLVSLSEVPNMNKLIKAAWLLAPIGHMTNGIRLLIPLVNTDPMYQITNTVLEGRLNGTEQIRTKLKLSPGDLCDLTAAKCGLCDNLFYLLFGYDAPQMNNSEISNIVAKFPNSVSVKTVAHYAQEITTCTFRKYDYGPIGNQKEYNSWTPPDYKLENIKVPTYFLHGELDNLGPPNDVNITASKFKKNVLKSVYKVKESLFNHADFVTAKDADKLVYNLVLKGLKKFKKNLQQSPKKK